MKIPQMLPSGKGDDLLAVDLSSGHVRIVHALQSGEDTLVFQHLLERTFDEGDEDQIIQYLQDAVKKIGIKNKDVICVIPSTLFISKNVDMPSSDPDEINKIVDLQAGRYTPYSRDEIVIDYLTMQTSGQHYTNVFLTIVNRKVVDRYYLMLEGAGLSVGKFVISSEGMGCLYDAVDESISDSSAVAGIHISDHSSDLTIFDNHQMVFVRNVAVGAENFRTDPEKAKEELLSEVSKSLLSYRDQGIGRPVQLCLITGTTSGLDFLPEALKGMEPFSQAGPDLTIHIVDYVSFFQLDDQALESVKGGTGTSYFDLMACLSATGMMKVDLTPKEIKLKRRVREGGKDIMTLGILVMACLVLSCLFLATKIYLKKDSIQKLEVIEFSSMDDARLLERASTKTRVVRSLLKNRGKALYVFERVTSLIGKDIFLTRFYYDLDGNIGLDGTAESMSRVYAFVTDLEDSNYFSSVKTKSTKTRRVGQNDVADFEIECTLSEEI